LVAHKQFLNFHRTVIDFFTSTGSSVFAAALDISKAFDTVCHSKLFKSLTKAGVHSWIVKVVVRTLINGFGSGNTNRLT